MEENDKGYPEVALRKESVDRNTDAISDYLRANVALRKESVDRNPYVGSIIRAVTVSLSARRAWIEMLISVKIAAMSASRSPQGERG